MQSGGPQQTPSLAEQVELLKQQLADAQKMAALGELVSTTTHEYNNVLMTVINYAKMGLRHKDDATRQKAFEKILNAGNRAAKITNGILGFARNRSGDFEPTDMVKLVDDALILLEREMNKYRISIERRIEENLPEAVVNTNQIQQVLLNLLINSRQAMERGGRIVIKLAFDEPGGMIELTVRDNGAGIPAEKLPHIFDPYFSTKSGPDETGKGGTGVGLSMCREIIEAHRGKIQVASTVGKGTAFTLKLPVAKSTPVTSQPTVTLGIQQNT
ncbi:MAG: sensor histidine kinase [Planctomycetota bacterium]|nr:MAG: sensor histidine kinase [Planctomycetota bacterium]REK12602.1 MAG: sensor histidine kinase [Planctomycetota bacterium]REK31569.1 MAG: sensor histidine kinase [Planctomycetota bacterium]REK40555.1 MAG: sensor histidine kinase [Planctomycetota bacterium]